MPGIRAGACYHETTGDKILDRTLDKIGGKDVCERTGCGIAGWRSDLSVHSLKDMPAEIPTELPLIGFSKREDPRDVLVLPDGVKELDFPNRWDVRVSAGCCSFRNCIHRQPLHRFVEMYRHVWQNWIPGSSLQTILAAAGLERLGIGKQDYPIIFVEE